MARFAPLPTDPAVLGTLCLVISAVFYSATNVGLRMMAAGSDGDWAAWVSCLKAFPSAVCAWGLVWVQYRRGESALPPVRLLAPLIATGCLMHFGGNLLFQLSLSLGGLALAVPITLGVIMVSGAILGRMVLGDAVTPRSAVAMLVLIAAVGILSQGAGAAADSVAQWTEAAEAAGVSPAHPVVERIADPVARTQTIVFSVTAACLAGIAYGAGGVMIRRTTQREGSIGSTLVVLTTTGFVGLGLWSLVRLGPARLAATPLNDLGWMLLAGTCNAIAFFACTKALQLVSVVRVNAINSGQAALCSLAGVWFFHEPQSWTLGLGVAMTMAGIWMMEHRPRSARIEPPT